MARTRRGKGPALIERLRQEPFRFDSGQALVILEAWHRGKITPPPEPARFRSSLSLAFPPSDLESIDLDPRAPTQQPVVTVRFIGLGGAMGPLPPPYTEMLGAAVRRGDTGGRDFLDLFNHRLVTTALTGARLFSPALQRGEPKDSVPAAQLLALLGLRSHGAVAALGDLVPALLPLTALVHTRPFSPHALERAIAAHFGAPARVASFRGDWLAVPVEQRSAIGGAGRHQRLGVSAMLGGRAWDQSAAITLKLGPMPLARARGFLPGGRADFATPRRRLDALVDFLVEDAAVVHLELIVETASVPRARLSRTQPLQLGWTSWLGDLGQRRHAARLGRTARLGGRSESRATVVRLGGSPPRATTRIAPHARLGRPAP